MRTIIHGTGKAYGYTLWLSARNTSDWSAGEWPNKHGSWPCSTVANKRLRIEVDNNGLVDMTVNGKYSDSIDGLELDAIVADSIRSIKTIQHLWPLWGSYERE